MLRARQEAFDLVLLDVMLPSLDGFEVCRELRKDSRIPIVMLTARNDTVDVVVMPPCSVTPPGRLGETPSGCANRRIPSRTPARYSTR